MQRNNLESSYKATQGLQFYIEHPYCYGQLGHFSTSTPFFIFPGVFRFLPKPWSWLCSYPHFKSNHTPRRSCSHKGGSVMYAWQHEKRKSGQWNWIFGICLQFQLKLTVKFQNLLLQSFPSSSWCQNSCSHNEPRQEVFQGPGSIPK